jgi:hypothetical protein
MKFIIHYKTDAEGPFDLVTVIRKIRNGSVHADTPISERDEMGEITEPQPAAEHPELVDFFNNKEEATTQNRRAPAKRDYRFMNQFRKGIDFFNRHQSSAVGSGILLISVLGLLLISIKLVPTLLLPVAIILTVTLGHIGLAFFELSLLRMYRGQPVNLPFISKKFLGELPGIAIFSAIITMLSLIGGVFLLIPGLLILTLYIFAPLLIIDQGMDYWEAMETSRIKVLSQGMDFVGIIFGLLVLNALAVLCLFFPLVFTLPMTFAAIIDAYEDLCCR